MSTKQEEKKVVKEKVAEQGASPVMYIGPNLLASGLKTYTVYKQEPVELISSLKKEHKNINRLFVPVPMVAKAREELRKKGSPISLAYLEARE